MATKFSTTEASAAAPNLEPTSGQLSFTSRRGDDSGVNLWSPGEVSGDWDVQCRVGREYGHEAVAYIRSSGDAAVLGGIVRTIAERGTYGGVEAGFFSTLSMNLAQ